MAALGDEEVTTQLMVSDSVAFAERLLREGHYSEADRIHLAAVASAIGETPTTLRHRYRLIRSALRKGQLDEAHRLLLRQDRLIRDAEFLAKKYPAAWRDIWLGEAHLLQIAWGEYYGAIGALGRSYEYRARAKAALDPFLEFLGTNERRRLERRFTHADFEAELCFAAGRYRSALECLDENIALLTGDGSEKYADQESNRLQLKRLRASALQLLASQGEEDPALARKALQEALVQSKDHQTDRLGVIYSLVKLELGLGDEDRTREHAETLTVDGLPPQDRALALALRLAGALATDKELLLAELEAAVKVMIDSWMDSSPRPGGRGWLYFNKVRFTFNTLMRAKLGVPVTDDWAPVRGQVAAQAFEAFLPALAVSDLARRLEAPLVQTVSDFQEVLRSNETALLLSPGQLPGVGFLVERSGVTAFPIAQRDECREAISSLIAETRQVSTAAWSSSKSTERWRTASARVAEAFFPSSVIEHLRASETVVFLARGLALRLPLELLYIGGEALCLQCSITDVPTPGVLASLRGRKELDLGTCTESVLLANVPDDDWVDPLGEELPSIQLNEMALREWQNSLGSPSRIVQGTDGGIQALAEGLMKGSPLAVIYSHGTTVDDPERPSALLLGTLDPPPANGRVGSALVETLPVADTVVLAACGSARAPQRVGAWGSNHLGGAFMLAGSRGVVLSTSDLPAEPTARLVGGLLKYLGHGKSLGESLLEARREIARTEGVVPPAHYALPILFGLPELRVVAKTSEGSPDNGQAPATGWLLVLVGVAGIAFWILSRARSRITDI